MDYLNNSKLLVGCAVLLTNIGGKYIQMDLPKSLDKLFTNIWLRRLVVFSIAFLTTRDIKLSIFITLLFAITFSVLLNEKNGRNILPEHYSAQMDIKDDEITELYNRYKVRHPAVLENN